MRRYLVLACLGACSQLPPAPEPAQALAPARRLAQPSELEVAIVVNNNAIGGSHAGMFAAGRLSDPSCSYVSLRSRDPAWPGVSLDDYVRFQLEDGENVRIYRFRLAARDFAVIDERIRNESITPPLFCAAAVQNHIAGVGPFSGIATVGWTSPSALAERLDALVGARDTAAACVRPSGVPC